jgi:hypothetical protein
MAKLSIITGPPFKNQPDGCQIRILEAFFLLETSSSPTNIFLKITGPEGKLYLYPIIKNHINPFLRCFNIRSE